MTKVIVTGEYDYADEFDYPVFSAFSSTFRDLMLDNMKWFPDGSEEFGFGTNEALEFERSDIEDMLGDSQVITDEELAVIVKFGCNAGLDVIDQAFDMLVEAMEEQGDLDDEIKAMMDAYNAY